MFATMMHWCTQIITNRDNCQLVYCRSIEEEHLAEDGTVLYRIIQFQVRLSLNGSMSKNRRLPQRDTIHAFVHFLDQSGTVQLVQILDIPINLINFSPVSPTTGTKCSFCLVSPLVGNFLHFKCSHCLADPFLHSLRKTISEATVT